MALWSVREAIVALENEGRATDRLLSGISQSDATRQLDGGWTIKDAVAHVAAWHTAPARIAEPEAAANPSGSPPSRGIDDLNEEMRREREAWTWIRVVEELATARRALLARLGGLTEAEAAGVAVASLGRVRPVWLWAWGKPRHELEHRRDVERALGRAVPAASVFSLNTSPGGVPKLPVYRRELSPLGLDGDKQKHRDHGGPVRALCLLGLDVIRQLQSEGHPIQPGSAGENVTIAGLDWATLRPGDQLRIGPALVELTRYTTPCTTIQGSFRDGRFERILETTSPGSSRFYASVLETGTLTVGDPVEFAR